MQIRVKIKKVRLNAKIPAYQSDNAAGFDLYADIESPEILGPMQKTSIPTGIAMQIEDKNLAGFCYARSGLATKYGITLSNGVGVIDNDYTGEIKVGLINLSDQSYTINPGDRIAQIVITQVYHGQFTEVSDLEETKRGDGGFGSTGKK